jgi:hypothetical protein
MVFVNSLVLALPAFKISIVLVCQVFSGLVSGCGTGTMGLTIGGSGLVVGVGAMLGAGGGVTGGLSFGGFIATLGVGTATGLGVTTGAGLGSFGGAGLLAIGAGVVGNGIAGGTIGADAALGDGCGAAGMVLV